MTPSLPPLSWKRRPNETLDERYAHIFNFRGDQVSEAWVINYDQAKTDTFWS